MSERTCTIEDCEQPTWTKGWCSKHYARWRRTGSTELATKPERVCDLPDCDAKHYGRGLCQQHYDALRKKPAVPKHGRRCSVADCDRVSQSLGLCKMHYQRLRRTGSTEPAPKPTECAVEDCQRSVESRGWCVLHYSRWWRTGSTDDPQPAVDVTYSAVHWRLRAQRGAASDHECAECGGAASQWSYDHTDPDERIFRGRFPYSLDLDRYRPMCHSCHISFDYWNRRKGVVSA